MSKNETESSTGKYELPKYEIDEMAELLPAMNEIEFKGLKEDIAARGQDEPIWLLDNKIIDGRNRYNAINELANENRLPKDFELETKEFDGTRTEAIDFVFAANLHRRQLNDRQRTVLAIDVKNMYKESNIETQKANLPSENARQRAADALRVAERNISYAEKAVDNGISAKVETLFKEGNISIQLGLKLSGFPVDEQDEIIEESKRRKEAKEGETKKISLSSFEERKKELEQAINSLKKKLTEAEKNRDERKALDKKELALEDISDGKKQEKLDSIEKRYEKYPMVTKLSKEIKQLEKQQENAKRKFEKDTTFKLSTFILEVMAEYEKKKKATFTIYAELSKKDKNQLKLSIAASEGSTKTDSKGKIRWKLDTAKSRQDRKDKVKGFNDVLKGLQNAPIEECLKTLLEHKTTK